MNTDLPVSPLFLDQLRAEIVKSVRSSKEGQQAFLDKRNYSWVGQVEAKWPLIRKEFDRLAKALDHLPGIEEISKSQMGLTTDKRWKIFPFLAYGHENKKNQDRCPETTKAVRLVPGVRFATFSILQPKKEIPPHMGPYCGVLRLHMGVKVPKPETLCGLSVGGQIVNWKEGESFIFDDSQMHYAWNRSTEARAVLLIDFPRPLEGRLATLNEMAINAIQHRLVDNADRHWDEWEASHGDALDRLMGS